MLLGAAGRISGTWRDITPEGLEIASAEGFAVLNLVVDDPKALTNTDIKSLKFMFASAGMVIGQTNGRYGGGLISPDPTKRSATIEFVKRMCGLTVLLDAPNTYIRPGSLNPKGPWLPHPENRSDEVFHRLVDSIIQLSKTAETEGTILAVEGGSVSPLYNAQKVRDLIDAVGSSSVGFNHDPVNFVGSLDNAYNMSCFLGEFFDLLSDVTVGAHTKDFRVVNQLLPRFEETEIGNGLLDHVLFLKNMQNACPNAHILIEHLKPKQFASANARYQNLGQKAGIVWTQSGIGPGN